jgi:hypothetical protein
MTDDDEDDDIMITRMTQVTMTITTNKMIKLMMSILVDDDACDDG